MDAGAFSASGAFVFVHDKGVSAETHTIRSESTAPAEDTVTLASASVQSGPLIPATALARASYLPPLAAGGARQGELLPRTAGEERRWLDEDTVVLSEGDTEVAGVTGENEGQESFLQASAQTVREAEKRFEALLHGQQRVIEDQRKQGELQQKRVGEQQKRIEELERQMQLWQGGGGGGRGGGGFIDNQQVTGGGLPGLQV